MLDLLELMRPDPDIAHFEMRDALADAEGCSMSRHHADGGGNLRHEEIVHFEAFVYGF